MHIEPQLHYLLLQFIFTCPDNNWLGGNQVSCSKEVLLSAFPFSPVYTKSHFSIAQRNDLLWLDCYFCSLLKVLLDAAGQHISTYQVVQWHPAASRLLRWTCGGSHSGLPGWRVCFLYSHSKYYC